MSGNLASVNPKEIPPSYAGGAGIVGSQASFHPYQLANYEPLIQGIQQASKMVTDTLFNSPLNPAVRAQMETQVASSQAGQQTIQTLSKMGVLPFITTTSGGQSTIDFSKIQQMPTTVQMSIWKALGWGSTGGAGKAGGAASSTGSGNGDSNPPPAVNKPKVETNQPETSTDQIPANTLVDANAANTSNIATTGGAPSNAPVIASANAANTSNVASAAQLPSVAAAQPVRNYFAQAGAYGNTAGAPPAPGGQQQPGTNLAQNAQQPGGQPPQRQPAAALYPAGDGTRNLYASTDTGQMVREQLAQRQQEQQRQQDLVNWQNTNQGGVMSAQAAKQWAQQNMDTDINRAVYLPNGGPKGEPAYAFYGKHGGTNIVPVSQMVRAGAGPLVQAQNSSQVLNVADQQNQATNRLNQGLPGHIPLAPGIGPGAGAQGGPPAPQNPNQPTVQPPVQPGAQPPPPQGGPPPAPTGPPQVPSTAGAPIQIPRNPDGSVNWSQLPGQLSDAQFTHALAAGNTDLRTYTASTDANGNPLQGEAAVADATKSAALPNGANRALIESAKSDALAGNNTHGGETLPNPNSRDPNHPDQPMGKLGDFQWYIDSATGQPYTVRTGEDIQHEGRLYELDPTGQFHQYEVPLGLQLKDIMNYTHMGYDDALKLTQEQRRDILEDERYRTVILPSLESQRLPVDVSNSLDAKGNVIMDARRIIDAIGDNDVTAKDIERNKTAQWGESQRTEPGAGGTQAFTGRLADLWARVQSGMHGQSSDKLNWITAQVDNLKQDAKKAGYNVDDLLANFGHHNFKQNLENFAADKGNDFQKQVSASVVMKYLLSGRQVDMSHAIDQGTPIYDPDNKYGEPKTKQMGDNQKAEIEYNNSRATRVPLNPNPSATPPPAAPSATPGQSATPKPTPGFTDKSPKKGPGSYNQPVPVGSHQERMKHHNVWGVDPKGNKAYLD